MPPLRATAGQILVNEALPEELRDYERPLDGKGLAALMQQIAEKHPDKYRDVAKRLSDIGRDVAYYTGGYSFGLKALRSSKAMATARTELQANLDQILASPTLDDAAKQKAIVHMLMQHQQRLEGEIFEESKAEKNPLAMQVMSGSRGKPMNLKSLRGGDLLYTDHHDNPIPIPILNSYSKGLSPAEYFAGAFGARKGVADTKFSTQDAGFFSKQLNQIGHRLLVTARDDDDEQRLVGRGLPTDVDDGDNEGALLAQDFGPYKRNTVLTPRVLRDLKAKGINRILVRSPIATGAPDGGLYARDVGVRERGGLPPRGDVVGIAAVQALSEPISQGQLSSKHSGGVAGASKGVSGFKYLNQLVQSPKTSPYWATHSQKDGIVSAIEKAPAGGHFVFVNGMKHYAGPDAALKYKVGDQVEAGDPLTDGIVNPDQVTRHKGIGEARRMFMDAFRSGMRNAGMGGHRRNIEVLARGLINHVRLSDEVGEYMPDDVIPYDVFERTYQPRDGARTMPYKTAVGKYLEKPVLHHTVGTRVTPSMLKDMEAFGIKDLVVHDDRPPFEPHFVRGLDSLQYDPDWMTKMLGSNLQKSLTKSVHRGAVSDPEGTSFVPALANPVSFGQKGKVKGFDVKEVKPFVEPATGGGVL